MRGRPRKVRVGGRARRRGLLGETNWTVNFPSRNGLRDHESTQALILIVSARADIDGRLKRSSEASRGPWQFGRTCPKVHGPYAVSYYLARRRQTRTGAASTSRSMRPLRNPVGRRIPSRRTSRRDTQARRPWCDDSFPVSRASVRSFSRMALVVRVRGRERDSREIPERRAIDLDDERCLEASARSSHVERLSV